MSETAPQHSRLPIEPGATPYVFICYSHQDAAQIVPHIEYLQTQGIDVWFDDGIRAGTIWRREIDEALGRATHVLFFVSRASLDSEHCQGEVHYGLEHKKVVVPVYLEDVELTSGLRVALTRLQALYAHRLSTEALRERLRGAIRDGGPNFVAAAESAIVPSIPLLSRRRGRAGLALALLALAAIGIWTSQHGLLPDAITGSRTSAPAMHDGVVILPFENGNGRESDAYVSEGFGDELRDQLAQVPGLRVVARPSSVLYRDQKRPASEIARELGVTTVVEGSLRKDGDRVRISVRLIDGTNDSQLWSQSYDRKAIDMLTVQQEIALAAARQISPKISAAQIPKPQWQASVHDLMLLARSYQQNAVSPADWDKAVSLYQQVVEADPKSALAHARLAKSMLFQGKDVEAAEAQARLALELDPNLAEGHAVLGFLLWTQFRRGVGQEYTRALELNPNDAEALHNYGEYVALQHQPAFEYLRRARDLDPMSLQNNADLAYLYATVDQLTESAEISAIIRERFPDSAGRFALSRIASAAGDLDGAIAWSLEARRLDPNNAQLTRDIAEWLARLGLDAESRKVEPEVSIRTLFWERGYDEIIARMSDVDPDQADGDSLRGLAFALQAQDRDAEAVAVLESIGLPQIALDNDLRRWASVHDLAVLIGSLQTVGDKERAQTLAAWLAQYTQEGLDLSGWGPRWWNACALSVLGKRDEALAALEATAASPNLAWLPFLRDAACFRELRNEPRYQTAIVALQGRHDAIRDRLPATLAKHGFTMEQI